MVSGDFVEQVFLGRGLGKRGAAVSDPSERGQTGVAIVITVVFGRDRLVVDSLTCSIASFGKTPGTSL